MISPKPFNLCDHIILRCEDDLMVLLFYTPLGFVETFLSPTSHIIGRAQVGSTGKFAGYYL